MKIRDIMKTSVIAVRPDESVGKALEVMKEKNINGTPIVDDENHLIGIIVKSDIYRFLIDPGHYKTCPVEWVMTKEVVKVNVEDSIIDGAKLLRERDIIAMPVVDKDRLVGMISIEDFVDHWIANQG